MQRQMDVSNFLQYSDLIATSGQPSARDFESIAQAGYRAVINLAMNNSVPALPGEDHIVSSLGMAYVQIPVPFDQPAPQHFALFAAAMRELERTAVWIHCALNKRVSAFMYLYNRIHRHQPQAQAAALLHTVWHPDPAWCNLIHTVLGNYGISDTGVSHTGIGGTGAA
ncbi:hypothetical protein Maes01_01805 [Microbulbifer aestuariivivens]|uniref:Phosphatase n=1 Tax=Microbulbifer aestuariivivens TaxID=1908308 RepID=A0ABP9WQ74_9GAMM